MLTLLVVPFSLKLIRPQPNHREVAVPGRFRVADPGVDRFRQRCDVFILQWIGSLERLVVRLSRGLGARADIFQSGDRATAASRILPWLRAI